MLARFLALAAVLSLLCVADASAAASARKPAGPLSPVLAELAAPGLAARGAAAQAHAVGIPTEGPASLLREGRQLIVTARFDRGAVSALPALRAAGAEVVGTDADRQTITLAVAPESLDRLAAVAGVKAIWEQREPILYGVGEGTCEGGSVVSEGLGQLRVDEAREAFGLRGAGQTVGVLSDSYNRAGGAATHAPEDEASGDLAGPSNPCPGQQLPVDVLAEGPSGGADEGRAMLQIVHDLAPEAELAFATAFQSESSFAQNIERLARPVSAGGAGADVIVDDVAWFEEPFFQDGPVAAAVNRVTAAGVAYLSAAGNDNLLDGEGHEIASWEAPQFRDAGVCPSAVGVTETSCMDFDPGAGIDDTYGITVNPGAELILDLQWAEPWFGVETDLDAFLLDGAGNLLSKSVRNNVAGGKPVEIVTWKNPSSTEAREVRLAIDRCFAACNPEASLTSKLRLKFALLENGGGVSAVEYPVPSGGDLVGPTIFGHAGAAAATSVGAIRYSTESAPERYSSRGPVRHEYGPVEGAAPAPRLAAPEIVPKPDFVATDCGATTFFASLSAGIWRFCGTSAAAPHAAALAALVRERDPLLSPAQARSKLAETARPVGGYGSDAVGAGLIDAMGALGATPWEVLEQGGTVPLPIPVTPDVQNPTPSPERAPSPPGPNARFTRPPATLIRRHPGRIVRTRQRRAPVVFQFGSDQRGVSFRCRLDRERWHRCRARLVRWLGPGRHTLAAQAVGSTGLADPTPAVFPFRVERVP